MAFQVYECSRASCRFRFPSDLTSEAIQVCPRCGAPTLAAVASFPTADGSSYRRSEEPVVVALLDNIRSAWNVGAILRTADGAGISHLHLCGITATPDHPRVGKTSLGAEEAVAWSYHRNGVIAGEALRAAGFRLWALESTPAAIPMMQLPAPSAPTPIALVVGNEKAGIDPGLQALCEQVFFIPMVGQKRSLNVAVAFGIAAYYLRFAAGIH